MTDRHLISVHELKAAGALDVPPSWRKFLGGKDPQKKNHTKMLWDEEEADQEEEVAAEKTLDDESGKQE